MSKHRGKSASPSAPPTPASAPVRHEAPSSAVAWRTAIADAAGFVLGGLLGLLAGRALGWDFIGAPGWGTPQILGLLLILVGMGGCRWILRRLLVGGRS